MKQEPVAWLCQNIDGTYDALSDKGCAECFPVYTAPRELSNDVVKELIDCLQEAIDGMGGAYAIWSPKARAILKKASEK